MTYLNLRSKPEIQESNLLQVLVLGEVVEIIGGPVYYLDGDTAYLWWQIQTSSGGTGWVIEGSQFWNFYYLEPIF
jgi:hypothetical protein